ncbi:FtsX-like permease family protein [Pseudoalteromonas sp. SG41-2]|uniref:ABC transporter permease n=1 Tax=Pseudoalteromonas sp. SG41-2 TaxID=2760978 RepID=UPI0016019D29|nr:ABC transporter permease [Pseudoalteromonas sp. SG41-2]MBB1481736.1 FtsX-like permease family protein [Pseudoalteromonas sp. SG41-2]
MFKNYIMTAMRSFKQQKQHFLLNVLGLSIGLAAAILVAMFAFYEASYDKQQPNAERVYRVNQYFTSLGVGGPMTNKDLMNTFKDMAEIEDILSLEPSPPGAEFVRDDVGYKLESIASASTNIADFVNIDLVAGDLAKVLTTPNMLALSEQYAIRIFGRTDIIGETLIQGSKRWQVGAVFADLPENTHFFFQGLIKELPANTQYQNMNSASYIRVKPGTDVEKLAETIEQRYMKIAYENPNLAKMTLHPLTSIHLTSNSNYEMKKNGSLSTLRICIGLSILLVLLAAFNFINMSIAQSAKRAKEVGVRKALGASKLQIISQFLTESLLITIIAALIACMLVELLTPAFNQLVDRQLSLNYNSLLGVAIAVVVISVGLLAGIYPAMFMSAFSAKRVLSGDMQRGRTAIAVRKGLLVVQSALSVGLIIGALLLQQQLAYLQSLPVGYTKESKLVISDISAEDILHNNNTALLNRINGIDGVNKVSVMDVDVTGSYKSSLTFTADNGQFTKQSLPIIGAGNDIAQTLGLTLVAGRDFSEKMAADWFSEVSDTKATASAILTESLVKQAGYATPSDAIGSTWRTSPGNGKDLILTVVGVVKNIKVGSVKDAQPSTILICGYTNSWDGRVIVDMDAAKIQPIKAQLASILEENLAIHDPQIDMLSENYRALYRNDERATEFVTLFSGLAVFLACVGTFGLASFSVLRRQKEVAVRKVLGASRISIMNLIAKEFLILVAASIAIAFPLTYWLVGDWLANFNERVDQALWVYLVAALSVAAITWLTVASLAFKAASTRPSLTLRYE